MEVVYMLIKDMTAIEMRDFLHQQHLGRLAFMVDDRPYVVPLFFVFNAGSLYSFTTDGQKVDAMRHHPKITVLFDQIKSVDDWRSVMVHGEYKEIAEDSNKTAIVELLNKGPEWWEPAYVRTIKDDGTDRPLSGIYFRIDVTDMSGHQAQK
ncbi:pyridoxamine 5'-phosphate oxidase family protein [Paraburkholderia aspalathi]|nr:pyridoxamine 5'-phosphate oxidase family protein [Paraburkholderia aspalathi]